MMLAPHFVGAAAAHPLQNPLASAGPQAAHIESLWWLTFWVCTVVLAAVVVATLWAIRRKREGAPTERGEARALRYVNLAVAILIALLALLFAASIYTDRALAKLPLADALHIEVTGYQWWWDVRYDDADASRIFTTANEMHIPVGKPVVVTLRGGDVIHSLWIPNLAGKKDLIPGRETTLTLRADEAGEFRAQCAEFCGYQHAQMALVVTAESPDDYAKWADRQRTPAPPPSDDLRKRGLEVFETSTCAMCHAVQGTKAAATRGPDLTHVASRPTLGAGAMPNTAADRRAWITDAQAVKPGANMPPQILPRADLDAVIAYVDSLQ